MKDILHFKNEKIRHSNIFQNIIVIERCFLSVSNQDSLFVAKHGQNIIHEYAFYCQRVPLGNLVNQRIIWFFPVQWIYPDLNFSLDIFHPAYSLLRWVASQLIMNSSLMFPHPTWKQSPEKNEPKQSVQVNCLFLGKYSHVSVSKFSGGHWRAQEVSSFCPNSSNFLNVSHLMPTLWLMNFSINKSWGNNKNLWP